MSTSPFAAPIGSPRLRVFAAGVPAAGGSLSIYQAGTTTADTSYPTYADALAGTNANANPVVLDANGEATVFLQSGRLYKVVAKDSAGSTLWTIDSYSPAMPYLDPRTAIACIKNGDQALASTSATKIATWTEQLDSNGEFASDKFTCVYAGNYMVTLTAELSDSSASVDAIVSIYKNGSEVKKARARSAATGGNHTTIVATHILALAAADYIEMYVTGTSGTTVYGTTGTAFNVSRIP